MRESNATPQDVEVKGCTYVKQAPSRIGPRTLGVRSAIVSATKPSHENIPDWMGFLLLDHKDIGRKEKCPFFGE